MNILKLSLAFALMSIYCFSSAQLSNTSDIAIEFMKTKVVEEGYAATDFQDYQIIHSYRTAHNGVTHVYIAQQYQGVEVEHAIFNVNILPDGNVFHHGNKGVQQIAQKVVKVNPTVGCHEAFGKCLKDVGLGGVIPKVRTEEKNEIRFAQAKGLSNDVLVRKLYSEQPDGSYRMVWDMNIAVAGTAKTMHYQVDVATAQILKKENITIQCQFDHKEEDPFCSHSSQQKAAFSTTLNRTAFDLGLRETALDEQPLIMDGSTYNIFPIPGESPNHINRSFQNEPADDVASPFGWHDTDGIAGAEFTITRGNNVHAAADFDGNDNGDMNEPDGGAGLTFNFPLNLNGEPKTYTDAATVNLFYMNNIVHDIAYRYGFDEPAGNFQEFNYTGTGAGGDPVRAFAQHSIDEDPSGETRNNANFQPSSEGFDGLMRMYVWERGIGGTRLLEIMQPAELAGTEFKGTPASFGPPLPALGITGEVVLSTPDLACSELTNASEVNSKIVIIDRGICNFDEKVLNASNAGAIAVVVCNFEEKTIAMNGSIDSGIPAVMIENRDCQVLKAAVGNGLQIKLQLPEETGPDQIDGTLDNGIVAHEYAHGISTRLVGGAQRAGCLSKDQQMGEGWSDFFTLALTVEDGDSGSTPRGIGTYAVREDVDGSGIRNYPYSTDMSINPLTFQDIILTGTSPHALGTVWCSMIWDLFWAMAEQDGFDADIYEGTGGNNEAIRLVMDGMKMLECSPTFTEARDGILAADVANNAGTNQQLIWEVFARRGLGFSAFAGDTNDRTQAVEAFDVPGQYDPELRVTKSVTDLINPGDNIDVTLVVTNDNPATENNVILNDVIPPGTFFVNNSASQSVSINGDQLTFNLGTLNPGQSRTITYELSTGGVDFSDFIWFDGFEEEKGLWVEDVQDGVEGWNQSDVRKFNEDFSYFIKNDTLLTDRALRVAAPVNLNSFNFPVLRFYHYIKSERGYDSGIVQLSRNGGSSWEDAGPLMFRNGYSGKVPYQPFALTDQRGFYGDAGDFVDTYIDLRDFIGDELLFRFRFGSDDENTDEGWYVDEVALFDMNYLSSEACVSSDQTTSANCVEATGYGSIIDYDLALDIENPDLAELTKVNLYPNPAESMVNITIAGKQISQSIHYKVFNVSGKFMAYGQLIPTNGNINHPIDVSQLPKGMYFVNFTVGDQQVSKRFVKQ